MLTNRIRKLVLLLSAAIFLFALPVFADEEVFSVRRVGQMISHEKNLFSVSAPEDGLLTVTISDPYHIYRIMRFEVFKGIQEIEWDGCSNNLEKLNAQFYDFDFILTGKSGNEYFHSLRSAIVDNAQFLEFVFPSEKCVWLSDTGSWFLEVKAVRSGTLAVEWYQEQAENPFLVTKVSVHGGSVDHYSFGKITGKKQIAPGNYTVQVYAVTKPSNSVTFPLQVLDGKPEPVEVPVTGEIMPADRSDDQSIWNAMMQPSVVVDIDYLSTQPVYLLPELNSLVLGTLHGQTQCLSVLEKNNDWAKIGAWNHETADYVEGWVPLNKLKVVKPNETYGLLVDKKRQTLTVYRDGEKLDSLLVSTGRMDKNKLFRETSAGMFFTGLHRVDFSMEGSRYDFVIQYDGGNLLHQIPYTSNGKKDFSLGRAYLGSKASHACIRIQDIPTADEGINAYWIWTHIPYRTKIIILDDPSEREKEKNLLAGNAPLESITGLIKAADPDPSDEQTAVLTFGGNVVSGSTEEQMKRKTSFSSLFSLYGSDYPFSGLRQVFEKDDLTCVNLECTLKTDNSGSDPYRAKKYRGLPEFAGIFPAGSVELVCLANEHADDFRDGLSGTIDSLDKKTEWIHGGHSYVRMIKNHMFGFMACTEQDYLKNPDIIRSGIQDLRSEGCEFIIVQCHWGNENDTHHGKMQEAMARACEREGADLVIGHHPGEIQGIDRINNMPVFYSLGNLVPSGEEKNKKTVSYLVQASFHLDAEHSSPEFRLIPVLYRFTSGENDSMPGAFIARDHEKDDILGMIQKDTPFIIQVLSE